MSYDKENKGVLFKNKNKKTDSHPDYNGSINIDGTDYWLSAWINESQDGQKYMSLSRGDEKKPSGHEAPKISQGERNDDFPGGDIPF